MPGQALEWCSGLTLLDLHASEYAGVPIQQIAGQDSQMDWRCSDRSRRVGFEGVDVRKLVLLHDSSSCKVRYDMGIYGSVCRDGGK